MQAYVINLISVHSPKQDAPWQSMHRVIELVHIEMCIPRVRVSSKKISR